MTAAERADAPVLVTGASGFLGSRLAAALAGRGFRVRALVRRTSSLSRLEGLGVELAFGDLTDRASLREALRGQRLVFHAAGRVSDWGTREQFERANVLGTQNLVEACRDAGVHRLVHTSTLAVLGFPRDGRTLDENSPCAEPPSGLYAQTKLAAERAVAGAGPGLETVIVRPAAIWGPGDTTLLPRFERLLRRGLTFTAGDGSNRLSLAHVSNVVAALVLAGTVGAAAGRLYHVTDGGQITQRELLGALAQALGVAPPRAALPVWLLEKAAGAAESLWRQVGSTTPPPLTRFGVELLACNCTYDISRARRELGFEPAIGFAEGMTALRGGQASHTTRIR